MKIFGPILLIGAAILLAYVRPYDVQVYPAGAGVMRVTRTHWLKPDKYMLLRWRYDQSRGEQGWCVEARARNEARPRWHLVLNEDGETIMATDPGWWRDL